MLLEINEIQHNRLKYNNIPPTLSPVCALFAPLLEKTRLFRALCLHNRSGRRLVVRSLNTKTQRRPACAAQHTRRRTHKGANENRPLVD